MVVSVEASASLNTKAEAEDSKQRHTRADAAATRKRGQGPAGVPELSIAEVGNVYPMNVVEEDAFQQ